MEALANLGGLACEKYKAWEEPEPYNRTNSSLRTPKV